VPVIVTLTADATEAVFTGKVAFDAPDATVTVAGTTTFGLLLVSETTTPDAGATLLRVMVPVDWVPPVTLAAVRETLVRAAAAPGGSMVSVALLLTPAKVAVMETWVAEATADVVMGNVVDVRPLLINTPGSTYAATLLLERGIQAPPEGAGPVKVTVPVEDEPPVTDAGFNETDAAVGLLIVSTADRVSPA
jgi:hypothetical protein